MEWYLIKHRDFKLPVHDQGLLTQYRSRGCDLFFSILPPHPRKRKRYENNESISLTYTEAFLKSGE
jgi:hypothetical protein